MIFLGICIVFLSLVNANAVKLNEDEKYVINEVKEKLTNIFNEKGGDSENYFHEWLANTPDAFILNFLEYHGFDIDKVEENLKETIEWRRKNKIDDILYWEGPEILHQTLPYKPTGYNDEGRPTVYFPSWSIAKAYRNSDRKEIVRHMVQMNEIIMQDMIDRIRSNETENISRSISLVNLGGIGFEDITSIRAITTILSALSLCERHYPFLALKEFLINVPSVAKSVGDLVGSSVSKQTASRMKIFSKGDESWITEIEPYIPKRNVPAELGGEFQNDI